MTTTVRQPSKTKLAEARRYWQRALRVEDWRVHAYFVRAMDIDKGYGMCHLFPPKRQAVIRIVTPEDRTADPQWEDADPGEYDWEVTLVHELLHVRFAEIAVTEDSAESTDDVWKPWEPVIHALSMALVEEHRR